MDKLKEDLENLKELLSFGFIQDSEYQRRLTERLQQDGTLKCFKFFC
jgi:hypothetical protein